MIPVPGDGGRCLLQRALDGDRVAVAELYGREAERIRAFLRRRDPSLGPADADDLTQSVFMVLLRGDRRTRFRGEASARTYLLGIARRLHLRHRQRRRRQPVGLHGRIERTAGPSEDPVACAGGRELLDRLTWASAQLPTGQRAAVLHVLGRPGATEGGPCSAAAVRRRLCDARKRLRLLLQEPP